MTRSSNSTPSDAIGRHRAKVRPFEGRIAVVTGASRGIGAATARALAEGGASVVLAARSSDAISELADELTAFGIQALAVATDMQSPDEIKGLAARCEDVFGRVDILVNNAGVLPKAARIERIPRSEWERLLAINLSGPFDLATRTKHLMAPGAVVINVASTAARYPSVGLGAYCVSKAGLEMLTRVCALEWAADGIRVLGVVPGKVETDMVRPIVQYTESRKLGLNPLRRLGRPEEVADAIAYLASDSARFMTGSTLVIDGGELLSASGDR